VIFSAFLEAASVSRAISDSIASRTRETALESVMKACKGLQKPEDLLQKSESKNSVRNSKSFAMTGFGDTFDERPD
jgi:hypothetical protein